MAPGEKDVSASPDERVPLGSWPRLYGAVMASAMLWIVLSAVFSSWPY